MQELSVLSTIESFLRQGTVALGVEEYQDEKIVVTSTDSSFGHYMTSLPIKLLKKSAQSYQSPNELAKALIKACPSPDSLFESITVADKGFINFKLHTSFLNDYLEHLYKHGLKKQSPEGPRKKCLVDYSSPNMAKEMHVGHLRSTIIGETLCRLLEYFNCEVLRISHVGDWGTQFGMLIHYIREFQPDYKSKQDTLTISDLTSFYREARVKFDSDPDFKTQSKLSVCGLQGGQDPEAVEIWKICCAISRREFDKVYDRLQVKLIERGESFYNPMIPEVIAEASKSKHYQEVDGAKLLFTEGDDVPLIMQKSDGGYGYDTTDVAAIKHRLLVDKCDHIFYVIDLGQGTHVEKLFKAAEDLGWKQPHQKCTYVGFGVVQGVDNKRLKTREGDIVRLIDLMDESVSRAEAQLIERNQELNMSSENTHTKAEVIGYSAIRYFDLRQNRLSSYQFSYDKILNPKGNTAVYVLYAYARICSILRKAAAEKTEVDPAARLDLTTESEVRLAVHLAGLHDLLGTILVDYMFHKLCEYVYGLATLFSLFYEKCQVLHSPHTTSRLKLCQLTKQIFGECLYLLGITPLEEI